MLIKMEGVWDGWKYDENEDVIFDADGNHYYLDEIRSLFYLRDWFGSRKENMDQKKIRYLRDELDRQIEKARKIQTPKVIIDWGDHQDVLEHPIKKK